MQDKSLVTADTYLNPERWDQMEKLAKSLVQSGAFPKAIRNSHQALVVMQAGVEMGLKPLEAINGLSIINGVVNPWGKTTVKLLRNHGWSIKYEALTERGGGMRATVTKGDESYTDTHYFDAAQKSGHTHHDNKLKFSWYEGVNRELKLRYGVLSKIIKTYIPEVLGSVGDIAEVAEDYIIEELPATDTNVGTKANVVMENTKEERESTLKNFLKENENNPKKQPKPVKKAKKVKKNEEKVAKTEKSIPKLSKTDEKENAIEGEVVSTESKE